MKITRSNDALVIVDFPYLIGLIAFPLTLFLFYHFVASVLGHRGNGETVGAAVGTTLTFLTGALFTKRSVFYFDLSRRELTWSRRGIFATRGGVVPFDQIRCAVIQTSN